MAKQLLNKQLLSFYSFLKTQGFIWGPEPDNTCYEPIPGHYTYGPLGKLFKNEVENYVRGEFNQNDYHEIDTPLIYPQPVWEASGHWNKFQDPIISTKSGSVHRLDKLIEEQFPEVIYGNLSKEQILEYSNKLESLTADDPFVKITDISYKNLMMVTTSGNKLSALRPETATTTYLNFPNAYKYYGNHLPIKLYQIGKAFRNEISPRQNVLRCREFTQAEAHIFLKSDDKMTCPMFTLIKDEEIPVLVGDKIEMHTMSKCMTDCRFKTEYYAWTVYFAFSMVKKLISIDRIRIRQHAEDEKAFYALEANDIEIKLDNIGWMEIAGIHDRGNYDLTQHKLKNNDDIHILEIAFGIDRLIFSLLDIYYDKKNMDDGKSIWKIPYSIAPIKISVLPLVRNNPDILSTAKNTYNVLKKYYPVEYDEKQSIGKRYLKSGMKGIPYCVTIDHATLTDNTVTIRDRDTENQIRLPIIGLIEWFRSK